MAVYCPLVKERVTYLACMDCDDKVCLGRKNKATVFACVGSNNSWLFSGRRVSRDSRIFCDIKNLIGTKPLFVSDGSFVLFENSGIAAIKTDLSLKEIVDGDCLFVERPSDLPPLDKIRKLVVYDFGRDYPIDTVFPEKYLLKEPSFLCEFSGTSHDNITRKVYDYGY